MFVSYNETSVRKELSPEGKEEACAGIFPAPAGQFASLLDQCFRSCDICWCRFEIKGLLPHGAVFKHAPDRGGSSSEELAVEIYKVDIFKVTMRIPRIGLQ